MLDLIHNEFSPVISEMLDKVASISAQYFRSNIEVAVKDGNFPVTIADYQIEQNLRQIIKKYYPDHNIIGEEYMTIDNHSAYTWVIDPIDGTVAFTTGKPTFTTLIALLKDGSPILGVIDQPMIKERFIGLLGEGAWFNGNKIQTNKVELLSQVRLNATTPYMFDDKERQIFDQIAKQVRLCSWGGDAYAYGLLASGYIDVIIESQLQYYDVAAVIPIITESGGVITDWSGNSISQDTFNGRCVVSANLKLHSQILNLIKREL